MKMVWVELDQEQRFPVRIFRNRKAAMVCPNRIASWEHALAVKMIRTAVFVRSHGHCEVCGTPVTSQSGHMHEQVHRGKGGEVSLANSVFICPTCHRSAHADRNPHWTKKTLDSGE